MNILIGFKLRIGNWRLSLHSAAGSTKPERGQGTKPLALPEVYRVDTEPSRPFLMRLPRTPPAPQERGAPTAPRATRGRPPGPGKAANPESAAFFRASLERLRLTQAAFIRRLAELGDDRSPITIARGVSRLATGRVPISGEMRVILNLLEREAGLQ